MSIGNETLDQIKSTGDLGTLYRIEQFVGTGDQDESNNAARALIANKRAELIAKQTAGQSTESLVAQAKKLGTPEGIAAYQNQLFNPQEEYAKEQMATQARNINQAGSARGLLYSGLLQGQQASAQQNALSNLAQQRLASNVQAQKNAQSIQSSAINALLEQQRTDQAEKQAIYNQQIKQTEAGNQATGQASSAVGSAAGAVIGSYFGPAGTYAGGVLGGLAGTGIGSLFADDLPEWAQAHLDPRTQELVDQQAALANMSPDQMAQLTMSGSDYSNLLQQGQQAQQLQATGQAMNNPLLAAIQNRSAGLFGGDINRIARQQRANDVVRQAQMQEAARGNAQTVQKVSQEGVVGQSNAQVSQDMARNQAISSVLGQVGTGIGQVAGAYANRQSPTTSDAQKTYDQTQSQTTNLKQPSLGSSWNNQVSQKSYNVGFNGTYNDTTSPY